MRVNESKVHEIRLAGKDQEKACMSVTWEGEREEGLTDWKMQQTDRKRKQGIFG